jgi:hypothetical protein
LRAVVDETAPVCVCALLASLGRAQEAAMDDDDDGEIYVPIKQRRAMKAAAMAQQAAGMQQQKEKRPRGLVAESTELC